MSPGRQCILFDNSLLDYILGRRTQRYWVAYLLGIPTLFIYTLVWMARIAEELKAKAIELGVDGSYTSWWHMFGWNTFGVLLLGPGVPRVSGWTNHPAPALSLLRIAMKLSTTAILAFPASRSRCMPISAGAFATVCLLPTLVSRLAWSLWMTPSHPIWARNSAPESARAAVLHALSGVRFPEKSQAVI